MFPPTKKYYENLVFVTLFPVKSKSKKDPQSFEQFIRQQIIPEVRWENLRYYGREEDRGIEHDALYPGHDYSTAIARFRLGTYPGHRKLFAVLDQLALTEKDINSFCVWEGTRSARERFERENNIKVLDLSMKALSHPTPPPRRAPTVIHRPGKPDQEEVTVPLRTPKVDYYGDPKIWSNNGNSGASTAQATEDAYRETLAISEALPRPPLQPLPTQQSIYTPQQSFFNIHPSRPQVTASGNENGNPGMGIDGQYGAHFPSGPDRSVFYPHIPRRLAYATSAYYSGLHATAPGRSHREPGGTLTMSTALESNLSRQPVPPPSNYSYANRAMGYHYYGATNFNSATVPSRGISYYAQRTTRAFTSLARRSRHRHGNTVR